MSCWRLRACQRRTCDPVGGVEARVLDWEATTQEARGPGVADLLPGVDDAGTTAAEVRRDRLHGCKAGQRRTVERERGEFIAPCR